MNNAFVFYHAKPALISVVSDINDEMMRIAITNPSLFAWRLDPSARQYNTHNQSMDELLKSILTYPEILDQSGDCASYALYGISRDDSALPIFLNGEPISTNNFHHMEHLTQLSQNNSTFSENLNKLLHKRNTSPQLQVLTWLNYTHLSPDLLNEILKALLFADDHLGKRLFQIFLHPSIVNEVTFLAHMDRPLEVYKGQENQPLISQYLLDLCNDDNFLKNYSIGNKNKSIFDQFKNYIYDLDQYLQVRFHMFHEKFNDPRYTYIKQYYAKNPSLNALKAYQQMINTIAKGLLEERIKNGKGMPVLKPIEQTQ